MRKREYLSPSAIKIFNTDPEGFYLQYLADVKQMREPQTKPMSVGSAFDAYVKSWLHDKLFGHGGDPRFEFDELFVAQVEEHNRDWAKEHGRYVFECYKASGALTDLLIDLNQAYEPPHLEIEIRGSVGEKRLDSDAVVLLGKPDLNWVNKNKARCVLDWKVNGYCSNSAVSPKPGYVKLRKCDGTNIVDPCHKDAKLSVFNGMTVNLAATLEEVDEDWGNQLAIYGWLLGEKVGTGFITAIDQIVAKPNGTEYPTLRIAEHRTVVNPTYQHLLYKRCQEIWEIINSDHIFRDMSKEDSQARAAALDSRAARLAAPKDDVDDLIKFHQPAWRR